MVTLYMTSLLMTLLAEKLEIVQYNVSLAITGAIKEISLYKN